MSALKSWMSDFHGKNKSLLINGEIESGSSGAGLCKSPPQCLSAHRGNSSLMITVAHTLHSVCPYLIASFTFKQLANHEVGWENVIKQPQSLIRGGKGRIGLEGGSPWGVRTEDACTGTVNYLCLSHSR